MENLALILCPLRNTAPLAMRYLNLGKPREIAQSALSNHQATESSISSFAAIQSSDSQLPSIRQKAECQPISAKISTKTQIFSASEAISLVGSATIPRSAEHMRFHDNLDRRGDAASQGNRSNENLNKLFTYLFSHNGASDSL